MVLFINKNKEIVDRIRNYLDDIQILNNESKELMILDMFYYIASKPMFLVDNPKFAKMVKSKIEKFIEEFGFGTIHIDFLYWKKVFEVY